MISGTVHKVQSCFAVSYHLSLSFNVLHITDPQFEIVCPFFWQEMMMKFAITQKISSVQSTLPASVKSGIIMLNDTPIDNSAIGSIKEMVKTVPENISRLGLSQDAVKSKTVPAYKTLVSKGLPSEGPYDSRAEKVPVLNCEDNKVNDMPQQNVCVLDAKGLY